MIRTLAQQLRDRLERLIKEQLFTNSTSSKFNNPLTLSFFLFVLFYASLSANAEHSQNKSPNIVVIMANGVGLYDLSSFNNGSRIYTTPNIDRLRLEGAILPNFYGENSKTGGHSTFLLGQSIFRTGLTSFAPSGSGIDPSDPAISQLLDEVGYQTGYFGEYLLGNQDLQIPTQLGFDVFFGTRFPVNRSLAANDLQSTSPNDLHGIIRSTNVHDTEDTGPLTIERLTTIDQEITGATLEFIEKSVSAGEPFFAYVSPVGVENSFAMQLEYQGISGAGAHGDAIVRHDGDVGKILDKLDELGVSDNTLVVYAAPTGSFPSERGHVRTTPYNLTTLSGDGRFRAPLLVRWPVVIKPGIQLSSIMSVLDLYPTIASVIGRSNVSQELKEGLQVGENDYKVYLDGYDFVSYLTGETNLGPRSEQFYFTTTGDLAALRVGWKKFVFLDSAVTVGGGLSGPIDLQTPLIYDIALDPFETTGEAAYGGVVTDVVELDTVQAVLANFLGTFQEFPPRQKPASFSLNQVMEKLIATDEIRNVSPGKAFCEACDCMSGGLCKLECRKCR